MSHTAQLSIHLQRGATITYRLWQGGPQLLLCLHGYGEGADYFDALAAHLTVNYTLLAINFPAHHGSSWSENEAFTPADLYNCIQAIPTFAGKQFHVIGYSMGGRVALSFTEHYPTLVQSLFLLASDGLQTNFWYYISTQTTWGNRFFKHTMEQPAWIFKLLKTAHSLKLINSSVVKFAMHYLHEPQARALLYRRWTVMRKFYPNRPVLAALLQQHAIPVHMVFGKFDKIIKYKRGEAFKKMVGGGANITVLPGGHQLLQAKWMQHWLTIAVTLHESVATNR